MAHKVANNLMLFTDGSANSKTDIGFGAYLVVSDLGQLPSSLKENVQLRCFKNTSSTKLELQTLLWALTDLIELETKINQLTIYTDSQNIIGLLTRREKLESSNYYSRNNKRLNNYELYQQFYELADQLNFQLVKLTGHKTMDAKDHIDHMFTLVDRASRAALRKANL